MLVGILLVILILGLLIPAIRYGHEHQEQRIKMCRHAEIVDLCLERQR